MTLCYASESGIPGPNLDLGYLGKLSHGLANLVNLRGSGRARVGWTTSSKGGPGPQPEAPSTSLPVGASATGSGRAVGQWSSVT